MSYKPAAGLAPSFGPTGASVARASSPEPGMSKISAGGDTRATAFCSPDLQVAFIVLT